MSAYSLRSQCSLATQVTEEQQGIIQVKITTTKQDKSEHLPLAPATFDQDDLEVKATIHREHAVKSGNAKKDNIPTSKNTTNDGCNPMVKYDTGSKQDKGTVMTPRNTSYVKTKHNGHDQLKINGNGQAAPYSRPKFVSMGRHTETKWKEKMTPSGMQVGRMAKGSQTALMRRTQSAYSRKELLSTNVIIHPVAKIQTYDLSEPKKNQPDNKGESPYMLLQSNISIGRGKTSKHGQVSSVIVTPLYSGKTINCRSQNVPDQRLHLNSYSARPNHLALIHLKLKKKRSESVFRSSHTRSESAHTYIIDSDKNKPQVSRQGAKMGAKSARDPPVGKKRIEFCPPAWTVRGKASPGGKPKISPPGGATANLPKARDLPAGREQVIAPMALTKKSPRGPPAEVRHDEKDIPKDANKHNNTSSNKICNRIDLKAIKTGLNNVTIESVHNQYDLASTTPPVSEHQIILQSNNCNSGDKVHLISGEIEAEKCVNQEKHIDKAITIGNIWNKSKEENSRDDLNNSKNGSAEVNEFIRNNGQSSREKECVNDDSSKKSSGSDKEFFDICEMIFQSDASVQKKNDRMEKIRPKTGCLKQPSGIFQTYPEDTGKLIRTKSVCILDEGGRLNDENDEQSQHIPRIEVQSPVDSPNNSTAINSTKVKSSSSSQELPTAVADQVILPALPMLYSPRREIFNQRRCHTARGGRSTPCPQLAEEMVGKVRSESAKRRIQRLSADQRAQVQRVRSSPAAEIYRRRREVLRLEAEEESKRLQEVEKRRQKARAQFQWAFRMVCHLARLLRVIIKISDDITVRTAVEEQWHQLNNSNEAKKLAFNPAIFARNRVYAKVPQWAKRILIKHPDDRTLADCRKLHVLLRGMRNWDKFTERIQLAMCKAFVYQYVQSGRVILRIGHIGQNFFFIYSGSVFVNIQDKTVSGEVFLKTQVVFSKGDSFGELSLLKDEPRTATITCRQDCELLSVDKEVFARICPQIFDKELEEKVDFLSGTKLFHSKCWTKESIRELCFEAQIQEHKTNKVVVLDSAEDDWIYICMEGQCRIIKCLTLDQENLDNQEVRDTEGLLTANIIQSKQENEEDGQLPERNDSDGVGEHVTSIHRRHLLDSMALDYVNRNKILDIATHFDVSYQGALEKHRRKKASLEAEFKLKETEEEKKRNGPSTKEKLQQMLADGVVTLNTLMAANLGRDMVYLDIGMLRTRGVFDLHNIINRTKASQGSSLILVSSGCKLLRIKRAQFMKSISEGTSEHVRYVAAQDQYPSDEVLLNSFREKAEWDAFKHDVTSGLFLAHSSVAKKRPMMAYIENIQEVKRKQENRLLNTLRKNKTRMEKEEHDLRVKAWEQCIAELQTSTPRKRIQEDIKITTPRLEIREIAPLSRETTPTHKLDRVKRSSESHLEKKMERRS